LSDLFIVVILGIVQGLTEFVPVSSTGHMILVEEFLGNSTFEKGFFDTFLVVVQLPSILAVIAYFWNDINPFVKDREIFKEKMVLWSKIVVGVLPAGVLGLLLDDIISGYLSGIQIIAAMLILYGIIFIVVEKIGGKEKKVDEIGKVSYKLALAVGFFQCLAMIPGTSRSGATIVGGLLVGLSRAVAAEFSFFLAIPTMFGATLLRLVKNGLSFTPAEWKLTIIGCVVSFVVSYVVIKWFMTYLKKRDFKIFGIYRIIVGILVFLSIYY